MRAPRSLTAMLLSTGVAPIQIFGVPVGDFSSPEAALVSALLVGFVLGAVPIGAAEVLILLLAGLEPRGLVLPLVLVATTGHVLGKLLWYWAGQQHHRIRAPWLRRQVDAAERYVRARPHLGIGALASSALVSVPPFHLTAIAAGMLRTPLPVFFLVAGVGRAIRFGVLAMAPDLVPWLRP